MPTNPNITAKLYDRVLEHPDRPAYAFELGNQLNYRSLWLWVDAIRARLRASDLNAGDRVVLLLPICEELVPLMIALFAEKIVPVLIDTRLKKRDWFRAIGLANTKHIITVSPLIYIRWIWWPLRKFRHSLLTEIAKRPESLVNTTRPPEATANDEAVLISLTSGSTGAPKIVIRNFEVLFAQQTFSSRHLPPLKRDVHLTGYAVATLQALIDGAFAILVRDKNVELACKVLNDFGPTRVSGSPAFIRDIVRHPDFKDASSVECVMTGGAPLPRWYLTEIRNRFRNSKVWTVYGSTECEPIALSGLTAHENEGPGYLVGAPIGEIECALTLVGEFNKTEVFEVSLRGPNIAHDSKSNDGFFQTGDLARRDEQGRLWLLGRRSEMVRGVPVGLLEEPLEGKSGIRRIAVVEHNDRVYAFAETEMPLKIAPDKLAEIVRSHLAKYRLTLERFEILPSLKVDRRHRWKIQRGYLRSKCR